MLEIEAIRLSSLCDFNADYACPLKNEASGREYWRVGNKKESFVLCYLDPDIGDHSDFINISESLIFNLLSLDLILLLTIVTKFLGKIIGNGTL